VTAALVRTFPGSLDCLAPPVVGCGAGIWETGLLGLPRERWPSALPRFFACANDFRFERVSPVNLSSPDPPDDPQGRESRSFATAARKPPGFLRSTLYVADPKLRSFSDSEQITRLLDSGCNSLARAIRLLAVSFDTV
jgi:hypothetical protein